MPSQGRGATMPGVRMPSALLNAAKTEARGGIETVAQVVRRALRDYVGQMPDPHDPQHGGA